MVLFSRTVISILFAVTLLSSYNVMASDDAYLKMLEGEAEEATLDQSGQIKDKEQSSKEPMVAITKKDWKWEDDLEGDVLPSGLAEEEFSSLLKQRFYGTFVFYRKLNSVDQQTVFYHYSKTPSANLDSIRQNILNHLKK